MSEISLKFRADALKKSLDKLGDIVENELNEAVKNLAHSAYAAIVSKVQKMNVNAKQRKDYLKGLDIKELGDNSYLIYLDGDWANKLEDGFGPHGMKEVLLASKKVVGVGPRSGQPWVRTAKDGHKYAAVPFEHRATTPHSSGDMATDIRKLMAKGINGQTQKIGKVFKDIDGKPIHGKVASVAAADAPVKNLANLTKFQYVHDSGKVSSLYMTWRMISENGRDWQHPGHRGYHIFKEAERFIETEMDNILKTLLK